MKNVVFENAVHVLIQCAITCTASHVETEIQGGPKNRTVFEMR